MRLEFRRKRYRLKTLKLGCEPGDPNFRGDFGPRQRRAIDRRGRLGAAISAPMTLTSSPLTVSTRSASAASATGTIRKPARRAERLASLAKLRVMRASFLREPRCPRNYREARERLFPREQRQRAGPVSLAAMGNDNEAMGLRAVPNIREKDHDEVCYRRSGPLHGFFRPQRRRTRRPSRPPPRSPPPPSRPPPSRPPHARRDQADHHGVRDRRLAHRSNLARPTL